MELSIILVVVARMVWHGFLLTALLWVCYLASMKLKEDFFSKTITPIAFYPGLIIIGFSYAVDFTVNLTVCTVVFLEFPREWTVTARFNRMHGQSAWGRMVTEFIAKNFLERYDPDGYHCEVFRQR